MSRIFALLTAVALAIPLAPAGAASGDVSAENMELVKHFPYEGAGDLFSGGTDIAFDGDFVYAAQQGSSSGGVHIYDIAGEEPTEVGFVSCPGAQNDVAVVESGIIALGYHSGSGNAVCGPAGGGVRLIDVHDPARPRYLGAVNNLPGGTHTLTVHPSRPVIYASPGGLPGNGGVGGHMQILDVSDPRNPRRVTAYLSNAIGCHDFSVFTATDGRSMGVCVGFGETQLWDLADPFQPAHVSSIVNPFIFYHHSGIATDDGQYLVIGDEAFGAHDCAGGPTGALWMYDVTTPEAPVLTSYFGLDRHHGGTGVSEDRTNWCTAHLYNFIPGTSTLVTSWYTGGVNVIDWSDPLDPREVAHYQMDGTYEQGTVANYWAGYWHEGRVYANDRYRGLDVLEVTGLDLDGGGAEALPTSTRPGWFGGSAPAADGLTVQPPGPQEPTADFVCAIQAGVAG